MNALITFFANNGTRVLGVAQGTVSMLCGFAGLIPESHMKYWLAASAVLTYWRGMGNTQAIANQVASQHAQIIANAVATGTVPILAPPGKLSKES
jgi:hypothetical protein